MDPICHGGVIIFSVIRILSVFAPRLCKSALQRLRSISGTQQDLVLLEAMTPTVVPNTSDAVFVITGGNRGLGIEHVKQFLEKTKVKVVATARQPSKADELNGLLKQYSDRLSIVELDTSSEESIEV